jgi:hypothetical protein
MAKKAACDHKGKKCKEGDKAACKGMAKKAACDHKGKA